MNKLIFFHMNQLGDLLFSLPVLAAARAEWPQIKLFSAIRPDLAPLLSATGLIDVIIPRQRNGLLGKYAIVRRLRQEKISRAILFSESPEAILLSYAAGIPERLGFCSASLSFLLTKKAVRTGVPSLKNNFILGQLAGLKNIRIDYTGLVKIPSSEIDKTRKWLSSETIDASRMVVVSPGASKRRKEKYWAIEKWVKLLVLFNRNNICPVLTGAPSELEELKGIAVNISPEPKIFPPTSGILSFAALLSLARLFVGIDSGAMHLAASLNIPVVALFGPTDPEQVGPQPPNMHRVIKKNEMEEISVEEVWAAICSSLK